MADAKTVETLKSIFPDGIYPADYGLAVSLAVRLELGMASRPRAEFLAPGYETPDGTAETNSAENSVSAPNGATVETKAERKAKAVLQKSQVTVQSLAEKIGEPVWKTRRIIQKLGANRAGMTSDGPGRGAILYSL